MEKSEILSKYSRTDIRYLLQDGYTHTNLAFLWKCSIRMVNYILWAVNEEVPAKYDTDALHRLAVRWGLNAAELLTIRGTPTQYYREPYIHTCVGGEELIFPGGLKRKPRDLTNEAYLRGIVAEGFGTVTMQRLCPGYSKERLEYMCGEELWARMMKNDEKSFAAILHNI